MIDHPKPSPLIINVSVGQMMDSAPVAAFGFSIVAELFAVRAEAKRPEQMSRCVHVATAIVSSLYLSVGLVCALAYPGTNSRDILFNFLDEGFFVALMLGLVVAI